MGKSKSKRELQEELNRAERELRNQEQKKHREARVKLTDLIHLRNRMKMLREERDKGIAVEGAASKARRAMLDFTHTDARGEVDTSAFDEVLGTMTRVLENYRQVVNDLQGEISQLAEKERRTINELEGMGIARETIEATLRRTQMQYNFMTFSQEVVIPENVFGDGEDEDG